MNEARAVGQRGSVNPAVYFLVLLPMLFWAGNIVLGRYLREDVPPLGITFWRWSVAAAILLPIAWPHLRAAWPLIRRHWFLLGSLGAFICVMGNAFIYLAVQQTTAINAGLVNATQPVVMVVIAWLLFSDRITGIQGLGVLLSLLGVLAVVARGDPAVLARLELNPGDLLMAVAVVGFALYAVLLRKVPHTIPRLAIVWCVFAGGAVVSAPFYALETALGDPMVWSVKSVISIGYLSIFASILAVFFWTQAVQALGSNRAGVFIYLIPVFASLLSVLFLEDRLHLYHIVGFVLVVAGIYLTERIGRPSS